jgi:steroid delta-isomerase-like uncharacterized protein
MESQNKQQIIQSYWDAYNRHDLEAILNLFAEDVIIHFPTDQEPIVGKENMRKVWMMLFAKVIPDISEEVFSITLQGNRAACQAIERGTLNIPEEVERQMNLPAANRSYTMQVGSFFRFNEEDLIEEVWAYWDTYSFSQQIGVDISIIRTMQSRAHK